MSRTRTLLAALFLTFSAPSFTQELQSQRLQTLVSQWNQIERQSDQLQHSWALQKPIIQQRIQLLNQQRNKLKQKLQTQNTTKTNATKLRLELSKEQKKLETDQQQTTHTLYEIARNMRAIAPRLPRPLSDAWQAELPSKTGKQQIDNNKLLDNILTLLEKVDDFQKQITQHQQIMTFDEEQVLVDQIYLGIGQGWYISRDGKYAGIGRPSGHAWQWHANNTLAPEIVNLLENLQSNKQLTLTAIPVLLKELP